jgi:histidinol-phosphate aminotransferase
MKLSQKICERFEGLVVVDEAYANFSTYTSIPLLKKYKNLAVARTFSKGFSFASERIGFIVADKEIIQIMIDVKLPYNVTYLSQIAAISALKNIEEYNKINEIIISERERMRKELTLLGLKVMF